MKKFMKVCAIIVGIILALGIILITIGGFNGGFKAVKSMVTNGQLIIGNHEIFSWDPDCKWDRDWVWNEDWDTYDLDEKSVFNSAYDIIRGEDTYETSFSASEISKLDMELGGCKVVIETSPDADYHVIANRISSFQTYTSGSTLYVRGLKTGKWVNWDVSTGMMVTVQVPKDTRFTDADLALGAGIFEIDELTADDCEIEIGAGQVTVDTLKADTLTCLIGAGRMVIDDAVTTNDVRFQVGAGELIYRGSIPGNLKADCGMGNMQITVVDSKEEDHNYKMECMAGNLTVGDYNVMGLAVDHDIYNDADSNFELVCAMGNLKVDFR